MTGLAAIRARAEAAREPILPHYDHAKVRQIDRARHAVVYDAQRLLAVIDAVERVTFASDDGTEYEHNGHPYYEGEPECPRCWAMTVRAVIADALKDGETP